jgi:4'-phosphopantetheinyl transferase
VMGQPCHPFAAPPDILSATARDVHVWKASLDLAPIWVQEFADTLSEDERARASRFFFNRDRSRFIVCRGVLRAILGRYLGTRPGLLEFRYGPYGKPAISVGHGDDALRFNISHAYGTAVYAVAFGREVGIDLERIRPDFASDEVAEQHFSPREVIALRGLNRTARVEAFFNCWTRKEAYLKARGEGLSASLDKFDVSLIPGEPAALLSTTDDPQEASRWSLRELFAGPDYAAAIAVEGHDYEIQYWQWSTAHRGWNCRES